MKYCKLCGKPMYTSNYSLWIRGKNYPAHKKCIQKDLKDMSLAKLFKDRIWLTMVENTEEEEIQQQKEDMNYELIEETYTD